MPEYIPLPEFAQALLKRQLCQQCHARLLLADVIAVGLRRATDGHSCFYYETCCHNCAREFLTVVTTRRVDAARWVSHLCEDQPTTSFPITPTSNFRPLPGLTLRLGARRSSALYLFGGYTGEVGPVMLLYRWHRLCAPPSDGVLRLESRARIRIAELPEDEKLPADEWADFLRRKDGEMFRHGDRTWRKLTRIEIEQIVRDRIFQIAALKKRPRRR